MAIPLNTVAILSIFFFGGCSIAIKQPGYTHAEVRVAQLEQGAAVDVHHIRSFVGLYAYKLSEEDDHPSAFYLRPGTYRIGVSCNRRYSSAPGEEMVWLFTDYAPKMVIEVAPNKVYVLDCTPSEENEGFKLVEAI